MDRPLHYLNSAFTIIRFITRFSGRLHMKYPGLLLLAVILLSTGCIHNWSENDLTFIASKLLEKQDEPTDPVEPERNNEPEQNGAVEKHRQVMMDFWNETIENTPSDFTEKTGLNFLWTTFGEFPHPTFKMGTEIAYQRFAAILLAYMQNEEIFNYLAFNSLFDVELGYGELTTWGSFRTLVTEFSSEGMLGSTPETHEGLSRIASLIAAND